jgi:hypothetical protein
MIIESDKTSGGELWGITTYFNPINYSNKIVNLKRFANRVRQQGVKLLIVDLAFGNLEHEVDANLADKVIKVRSRTVLWQRERLFNIAVDELPARCDKVVWLDADIIFSNEKWVSETINLLERFVVVQPFRKAWCLNRQCTEKVPLIDPVSSLISEWEDSSERSGNGVAYSYCQNPSDQRPCGHSGFAWAFRRNVLDACGFYDRLILGGNDTIISAAILGISRSEAFQKYGMQAFSHAQFMDAVQWMERFSDMVQSSVSFTEGSVYHLWHGELKNRRYGGRQKILRDANFDPLTDIALDEERVWRWNTPKTALHNSVRDYFVERKED